VTVSAIAVAPPDDGGLFQHARAAHRSALQQTHLAHRFIAAR
jgi:hypothetical protein